MSKKKIKILYTIPNFDTAGSGKVVYDLVNNLDRDIFEPAICCFHDKGAFFKEVEKLNVKIHIFKFTTNYYPLITFPLRVFKIRNFFKKHQFDIIHSWHWSSDFSEPLAAKLAGIKFVYTKKAMGWGNRAWKIRSLLSTKIIAINDDMIAFFFNRFLSKTILIPLGLNTSYYLQQPKCYKSPEGIIFSKKDFVITSIANFVPVKGIELLIDAVLKINDRNIKLLFVGNDNNEYANVLKNKTKSNKNIFFLGKKNDVRPYLALCDLFVIPTKNEGKKEGMPMAPVEAMSSGRIVLGSNISGINDILKGFHEFLFEPNNAAELVQKITLIKNMEATKKNDIEKKMRIYVRENFSMAKFIASHQKLYRELIA